MHGMIDKNRDHTTVAAVVLVGAVAAHRADTDYLDTEHLSMIKALELTSPLGDSIIVHLFNWEAVYDILGHQAIIITVNLGTGEENLPEAVLFLEAEEVLSANHVGVPEVLVVIFAVPASVLGCQVIDAIELMEAEDGLQLPVGGYINAQVLGMVTLEDIESPDIVTTSAQLTGEVGPDKSTPAGD